MRLSDHDIKKHLNNKTIIIDPAPNEKSISGVSVDLTLGNSFRVFRDHKAPYVDLSGSREEVKATLDSVMQDEIILEDSELFFLHPGELVLAVTYESITLPKNIVAWLDGRSSLARLGLMVHATAHRIDPGWSGNIVLEFVNNGKLPLALKPKMTIAAVNFEIMSSDADLPYNARVNAKYKQQEAAVMSKIDEDNFTYT